MSISATPALPAVEAHSAGLVEVLLNVSLTGILLLRPIFAAGGDELTDFAWERLNPAAQRMLRLPERPAGSFLTLFPMAQEAGVFGFYRDAFQAGQLAGRQNPYQHEWLDGYYQLAAQRYADVLVVSFTDTNDQPRTAAEQALRASQAREQAARAEAEAQHQALHQILMQLPASMATLRGPAHVFELVSPQYQQLFSLRPLRGLPLREALPELAGQGYFELFDQVYRTGEPYYAYEREAVATYAGDAPETRYFNFFVQALRGAGDEITGILNFAYDVTPQVRARRLTEEKERQATRLNAALQAANAEAQANNADLEHARQQLHQLAAELEARVDRRTEQVAAAQAEAEAQRQRLETLITQAPALIASLTGPRHLVELANAGFRQMFGNRELVGRFYAEAAPELVSQQFIALLDEVYRTGETYYGQEAPAKLDCGAGYLEQLYFNFIYQATRDAAGLVSGVLIFAYDVTEQVLARRERDALQAQALAATQHQVREREELYQVFEQAPVIIALVRGPEHFFYYYNPAYRALFPGRALTGRPYAEAMPEIRAAGLFVELDRVYATGRPYFGQALPVVTTPPDGGTPHERYYDFSYHPYREAGAITGVAIFAHDVTDQVLTRREREAQRQELQRIFEQAPMAVTVLRGPAHLVELANPAMCAIWGRPASQLLGRPYFEAVPDTAGQGFEKILADVLRTGEPWLSSEAPVTLDRAHTDQPALGYFNFIFQSLRDEQQRPVGIVAIAQEVTDQVRARAQVQTLYEELAAINEELRATNEELHDSNTRLSRTNADLDTFVYSASHDLKSPITNIEGLLLALRQQLPPAALQAELVPRLLSMMDEAVARFQQTLGYLTDVSRLQQTAFDQPTEAVDLPALVEAVRLDILPELTAAQARLTLDLEECPPLRFSAKNLRSILYNLLSNAIKYRDPARLPRIVLSCHPAGPGRITLVVQDNGLGLSTAQQGELFRLFRRLHNHVPGSGVGLYMVKKMVDNADGILAVESTPGVGSTFRVTLPVGG